MLTSLAGLRSVDQSVWFFPKEKPKSDRDPVTELPALAYELFLLPSCGSYRPRSA